ncbi:BZ3500_MvSof-1268-A1-R1_Chr1-1g00889 [Microbotryum saponariae]|uniref:Inositol-3-phosphate synthase n=1 Tax=Microbotryum saponariae TaxID=289078 RepID=A0A2X0KC26_9BASI|nr:BZ3500_MvSof-1268-A1-R1_Chr1-1g00889 [Microbotryum saponariae]SCZ92867.1 BZ3501_MvSof-1269-A2-R1_Chr1-1g00486 [Microbotryum saponariae]
MAPIALDPPAAASTQPASRYNAPASHGNAAAIPIVDPTAARRPVEGVQVESENLTYTDEALIAKYLFHSSVVKKVGERYQVKPVVKELELKTLRKVPKTGLMLVGWGGNNGTTLSATLLANKNNISWNTRDGTQSPNYLGSLVRASTVRLGEDENGRDVFVPFSDVLPMVHPNDLVVTGWDISAMPLDRAMRRAKVMDYDLQRQLAPMMAELKPMPSIYYPTFINANQEERADNVLPGNNKAEHLAKIRSDIRNFKANNNLDTVIVLWTANTERYSELIPGINDTKENLLKAVDASHPEVSPSTIFAMASILEGCPYINGAPQNTFVPGCIELAEHHNTLIGGDDFKSGQTKVKSVLAEFLVNAGIKPLSIASYNHLGNNDGRNLSAPEQFRSKEISKSSVVDDMVEANHLLYKPLLEDPKGEKEVAKGDKVRKTEHPDHCIVIKYLPAVGDDKRALDEYNSEIMMGGRNTLNIFNECQDSLLATPLIIDLALLAELLTRVTYRQAGQGEFESMYQVASLLSFMLKAPLVKPGKQVINSFSRQRNALEAFLRACLSLQPTSDLINFTNMA